MFGKAFSSQSSQCPLCQHHAVPQQPWHGWGTQPVLPLVPALHGGCAGAGVVQGAREEQCCVSPQLTLLKALFIPSLSWEL